MVTNNQERRFSPRLNFRDCST